ncbi:MAG: hypothetical protein J6A37_10230, partial [Oscillospiraceae bacterium]|nr:hypothetical protein [Oscillospiraceae bacterium]
VEVITSATNNTDDITELKNCTVRQSISTGSSKNIFYCGGLKKGMPYTEFIELFGEPDYIDEDYDIYVYLEEPYNNNALNISSRMYSATGYELSVYMDMDNGCVSSFSVSMGNRSREYEESVKEYKDGTKIHWNAPGDLAYDDIMTLEADGKGYLLEVTHWNRFKDSFDKQYFLDELTEESLTDKYNTKSAEVKYCKVNDDGTAYVITLDNKGYYTGYFYSGDFMKETVFRVANTDKDDDSEIPETAKDQAYNILVEVLKRGVVYEEAAD